MIDIFGGESKGGNNNMVKRGPPGQDAVELTKYVPRGVMSIIRTYDMYASYALNTKNDCILYPDR